MIESTQFGQITIDGITYDHDVVVKRDGTVKKRKKRLSKNVYGTSHIVSLEEVMSFYEEEVSVLIFGTGQYGRSELSAEARLFLEENSVSIQLASTPEAIRIFNQTASPKIGVFHVTC